MDAFFERLKELRVDIRAMAGARLVAVGPKTAAALEARGLLVEAIPPVFQGDALLESLAPQLKAGERVLLATADIARTYLPDKMREMGLDVTKIDIYENVLETEGGDEIVDFLRKGQLHIVTFTSSSTVTNLLEALKRLGVESPLELLQGCKIACIGPMTAQTAEKAGLKVDYLAKEATVEALVQSLYA